MRISKKAKEASELAAKAVREKPVRVRTNREREKSDYRWVDDAEEGCVFFDGNYYWSTQIVGHEIKRIRWEKERWEKLKKR